MKLCSYLLQVTFEETENRVTEVSAQGLRADWSQSLDQADVMMVFGGTTPPAQSQSLSGFCCHLSLLGLKH